MALRVYNTLTRKLERFKPISREHVNMYVCGPTVYDHAHLGHAKLYISMDVIARYLKYRGYRVTYVRNFTDVGHILDNGEDRILRGARRERKQPMEIVDTYIRSFNDDMDALGLLRPNISPRATCHVPDIIVWVEDLIRDGYAYEVDGNVYFSVDKADDYGKLANRNLEDMLSGSRVKVREDKRNPADFALWKRAEPEHVMRWRSPWGDGYPGWHIECSVMANKYLGETFDIHGGGLDNMFPHNECEIAQSEAHSHGATFANHWLHTGSLTVDGIKMSKSLGNFLTLKDALQLYSPEAIRYFVLSSHYRSPMDYSRDVLTAAQRGVDRLHDSVRRLRQRIGASLPSAASSTAALTDVAALEDYREQFKQAMDNDFNTPEALSVVFEMVRECNRLMQQDRKVSLGALTVMDKLLRDTAGNVLGILPDDLEASVGSELVAELVEYLLELRESYREARDYNRADEIRDRLDNMGVIIEDGPNDTTWHLA